MWSLPADLSVPDTAEFGSGFEPQRTCRGRMLLSPAVAPTAELVYFYIGPVLVWTWHVSGTSASMMRCVQCWLVGPGCANWGRERLGMEFAWGTFCKLNRSSDKARFVLQTFHSLLRCVKYCEQAEVYFSVCVNQLNAYNVLIFSRFVVTVRWLTFPPAFQSCPFWMYLRPSVAGGMLLCDEKNHRGSACFVGLGKIRFLFSVAKMDSSHMLNNV